MAEYESSLPISASPDTVFDFVSDIANLPKYLPTTHHAEAQGPGRVRVQGEAAGQKYDSDGWFRPDPTEQRLEWGSDGESRYSGWLEIEGDGSQSLVTVHLSFAPRPDQAERFEEQGDGDGDATIQQGLQASLLSIKNLVEGTGGKIEPPAAT